MRFLSFLALVLFSNAAAAQSPLSGNVSSAEEGAMEGVLVSAKKVGSTITLTVVSDEQGRYAFPAKRLAPGRYTLGIRAVGYELESPLMVTVTNKGSETELKLKKAADLAAQLSNGEWLTSAPGTDRQKDQLLNCVGCHSLQRVVHSRYDADTFAKTILPRMQGYVNQSIPQHPQLRKAERLMEERGDQRVQVYRATAEYLSTINLAESPKWGYELKTFPRPSGRATRVVYTEYDLPRETISPHDVMVDA
jgi:virginiamycin B lyase